MKNLDQALTTHYRERSDHFYHAMELLADDLAAYSASVALLAVHSCISLNDAIAAALTGRASKHEDHLRAADGLEKLCNTHRISDQKGVGHFRWLLARKTDIAYGAKRLDPQFVGSAKDKAEKFSAWAYNNFEGVLRGLWAGTQSWTTRSQGYQCCGAAIDATADRTQDFLRGALA